MDFAIQTGKAVAHATTGGAAAGTARTGMLMGMTVAQVSAESPLLDAAAELGLRAGESMADEISLKDFEQDREMNEEHRVHIQKYKELMGKEQGKIHSLEALKDFLESRHERRDNQREIARFFSNPTELYVALGYILSTIEVAPGTVEGVVPPSEAATRAEEISEIRWLMDDLEERHGPRIHADMVGALHSVAFGDLGPELELGGFYGQTVCDFTSVNDVFAHVHSQFGPEGFERAMDFLFGALGADMASHQPSMEMTHLEHVQKNIGQVRLMQNIFLQCENLLQRWSCVHGVHDCGLTPLSLSGQLIDLRQHNYLGAMHIEAISAQAEAPDVEREVLFLQEMLTIARALPSCLFDDDEGRMKVLKAVQEAVDRAVEKEDAWLAAR